MKSSLAVGEVRESSGEVFPNAFVGIISAANNPLSCCTEALTTKEVARSLCSCLRSLEVLKTSLLISTTTVFLIVPSSDKTRDTSAESQAADSMFLPTHLRYPNDFIRIRFDPHTSVLVRKSIIWKELPGRWRKCLTHHSSSELYIQDIVPHHDLYTEQALYLLFTDLSYLSLEKADTYLLHGLERMWQESRLKETHGHFGQDTQFPKILLNLGKVLRPGLLGCSDRLFSLIGSFFTKHHKILMRFYPLTFAFGFWALGAISEQMDDIIGIVRLDNNGLRAVTNRLPNWLNGLHPVDIAKLLGLYRSSRRPSPMMDGRQHPLGAGMRPLPTSAMPTIKGAHSRDSSAISQRDTLLWGIRCMGELLLRVAAPEASAYRGWDDLDDDFFGPRYGRVLG